MQQPSPDMSSDDLDLFVAISDVIYDRIGDDSEDIAREILHAVKQHGWVPDTAVRRANYRVEEIRTSAEEFRVTVERMALEAKQAPDFVPAEISEQHFFGTGGNVVLPHHVDRYPKNTAIESIYVYSKHRKFPAP